MLWKDSSPRVLVLQHLVGGRVVLQQALVLLNVTQFPVLVSEILKETFPGMILIKQFPIYCESLDCWCPASARALSD